MNEEVMMDYIRSEPDVVREILNHKEDYCKEFVGHFLNHPVKRVYLSGHGSPYHAGMVLRFMMEKLLKVDASIDYPTMFLNHSSFNANLMYKPDEMLLLCPAQSGRTTGPVYAARKAKSLGMPVVCTTMWKEGVLAKECDIVIEKKTGIEESFPETKGHLASMVILMICVVEAARELGRITLRQYRAYQNAFADLPRSIDEVIKSTLGWYEGHKQILLKAASLTFLGYGVNYATAEEGGLKILETTLKPCMSYECEEFMHGQNQLVTKDSILFFLCPKEPEQSRMHDLVRWCRCHTEHCYMIASREDEVADAHAITSGFIDCEFLTAVEYLVPFQILSYVMARDMGKSCIVANHDHAGRELGIRFE